MIANELDNVYIWNKSGDGYRYFLQMCVAITTNDGEYILGKILVIHENRFFLRDIRENIRRTILFRDIDDIKYMGWSVENDYEPNL